MKKNNILFNHLSYWLKVIATGLALGLILQFARAWTEPSQAPPGGNLGAPLNTSNLGQYKIGGLVLNTGGATNGLIVQSGNVGIGTLTPQTSLDVAQNGAIKVGNAYLSSGGNYAHLATNELFNGSRWITNGSSGALLQMNADNNIYFYTHDSSGNHTWNASVRTDGYVQGRSGLCIGSDCRSSWPSGGILDIYGECICNAGSPTCRSSYRQVGSWTGSCCPGDWCGPVLQCVLCAKY